MGGAGKEHLGFHPALLWRRGSCHPSPHLLAHFKGLLFPSTQCHSAQGKDREVASLLGLTFPSPAHTRARRLLPTQAPYAPLPPCQALYCPSSAASGRMQKDQRLVLRPCYYLDPNTPAKSSRHSTATGRRHQRRAVTIRVGAQRLCRWGRGRKAQHVCREGTLALRSTRRRHRGGQSWTEAEKQGAHTWRGEIPHGRSKATFLLL